MRRSQPPAAYHDTSPLTELFIDEGHFFSLYREYSLACVRGFWSWVLPFAFKKIDRNSPHSERYLVDFQPDSDTTQIGGNIRLIPLDSSPNYMNDSGVNWIIEAGDMSSRSEGRAGVLLYPNKPPSPPVREAQIDDLEKSFKDLEASLDRIIDGNAKSLRATKTLIDNVRNTTPTYSKLIP